MAAQTGMRRHLREGNADDGVSTLNFDLNTLKNRYFLETFMSDPLCLVPGISTDLSPAGTSLQAVMVDSGFNRFQYSFLGEATASLIPLLASEGGWNWNTSTNLDGIGVEVNFGGDLAGHPRNCTPSSEDWFFRALVAADDWSGADITLGFKKAATALLTLTEVTDIAGVRLIGDSSSALAAITVVTVLNNAGATDYTSTAVDTGSLTDETNVEIEIRAKGGKAKFYVNGAPVAPSVDYTFDSGDKMSPVIRLIQATDLAAQLKTLAAEGGPLYARRPEPLTSLAFATS